MALIQLNIQIFGHPQVAVFASMASIVDHRSPSNRLRQKETELPIADATCQWTTGSAIFSFPKETSVELTCKQLTHVLYEPLTFQLKEEAK